jgi:hypothetical protein
MAATFTGAAVCISIAQQPVRLGLDHRALLVQWKPNHRCGLAMRTSFTVLGRALGIAPWIAAWDWRWLLSAALLLANRPFTVFAIILTDDRLMTPPEAAAGVQTRRLIER